MEFSRNGMSVSCKTSPKAVNCAALVLAGGVACAREGRLAFTLVRVRDRGRGFMHYPWWYVPYLTAPMLIAVISVVHVLVSHYAVGGGLFLAVETRPRLSHRRPRVPRLPEAPRAVLHPADRRLRRDHRRGHLVDDRAGLAAGHRSADPHVRLRLGHRMGLLRGRNRLGLHLLLLLGPARPKDARRPSAGSTPWRRGSAWC